MVKIDESIPIPGRGIKKFPWEALEIGHSFWIPEELLSNHPSTMAYVYGKRLNRKFTVRLEVKRQEDGTLKRGYRVWRTA